MIEAERQEMEPNDPTRSGPPVPEGHGARLSLNETEQLCLKAARGAGMSWGLAEEAGFAAAWLAMRGLDGPGALLAQISDAAGRPWHELCPEIAPGRFRASADGALCPIALGAALCDHARLPEGEMDGRALRIGPVSHPILLLAFLSDLARMRCGGLSLDWPGGRVMLDATGGVSGDTALLMTETGLEAELSTGPVPSVPLQPAERPLISAATLGGLNAFAMRTTVPASEASRAGAGAGTGDND